MFGSIAQGVGSCLALATRYSSAGLAHSAADHITAKTGEKHQMRFKPQGRHPDRTPFVVVHVQDEEGEK